MICASIGKLPLKEILEVVSTEELVELRFDLLTEEVGIYREVFGKRASIIATCRSGFMPEDKQKRIYTSAMNWGAAYIDLELEMPEPLFHKLRNQARRNGIKIIGSYHNFFLTPSELELKEVINKGEARGCDLIKIATVADTFEDAARLLSLLSDSDKIIVSAMGKYSKIVRFAAPLMGAEFTYGAADIGAQTAQNQPSTKELRSLFEIWQGA